MLTSLPNDSKFMAHYTTYEVSANKSSEVAETPEELTATERLEREFLERQEWADSDLHIAELANLIVTIISILVNDKKFKPEPVGPDFMLSEESARDRQKRRAEAHRKQMQGSGSGAKTIEGLYRIFGAPAVALDE